MKRFARQSVHILPVLAIIATCAAMIAPLKEPVGVGAKAPKGAEVLFDGSRKMLDDKWV